MQLTARGFSQGINLSVKDTKLENVFALVEQQTKFRFVYSKEAISLARPVSIELKNANITQVLELCFAAQPLTYTTTENFVVVKPVATVAIASNPTLELKGKVVNENNEGLPGITIQVKGSRQIATTNEKGEFSFSNISASATLIISGAEINVSEVPVNSQTYMVIKTTQKIGLLDESLVVGYGTTTRRFNTGSVSKITADEISRMPAENPLASLQGRVPGLLVTATSGIPGSSFMVQIRGQNSINPNPESIFINPFDQPLFIIDGVPFAPQNENINQYSSAASPGQGELYNNASAGMSPFQSINPADIESIEVLRDADATAIYGSRAANGVILITTKKGKAGKTKFMVSAQTGVSHITRSMRMMSTEEYLSMRKEAFANNNVIPNGTPGTAGYAPDLTIFDNDRYTDWRRYFLGGSANSSNINLSLSGGSSSTQFLLGAGYSNESNIFPGEFGSQRGSFNLNVRHRSVNQLFQVEMSANFSYSQNNTPGSVNILTAFTLPPNYPSLLDDNGEINWTYKGITLDQNPLGYLKQSYLSKNYNLISKLLLSYEIYKGLVFKISLGYNNLNGREISRLPRSSFNPNSTQVSSASFGSNDFFTIIAEPQADYKVSIGKGRLHVLLGATYQSNINLSSSMTGTNYSNDALMGSISAAANKTASNANSEYKYAGVFTRINYIHQKKYIFNLSARRDGSSRFGPGRQFGNFASAGIGWIFSEEPSFQKLFPFLSYGKLRSSYGLTGSDAIGNYQYYSRWGISLAPYQSVTGYVPQNLYNPDFSWSTTHKFEAAVELGFLQDRVLSTIAWYRNRSGNQLVNYNLPAQTGFSSVIANFPATVQNSGVEITVTTNNIRRENFSWSSNFNISFGRNKLVSFPGIESSSYAREYNVGEPLSVLNTFHFLGVNPATGLFEFNSVNGATSNPTAFRDYIMSGNTNPEFSGGLSNSISWKGFQFDLFLQFTKQKGRNYLGQVYQSIPGTFGNQPAVLLSRWQQHGDVSFFQKLTHSNSGAIAEAAKKIRNADIAFSDASFLRVKNLSISYNPPAPFLKKFKVEGCRFYIHAQNLFTLTSYKGNDPETMSFYSLPPLQTIVGGIQLTF